MAATRHEVRYRKDIAVLVLNDEENRLNLNSISAMTNALEQVERNPNAKALVIVGTGKFFSNGMDLKWLSEQDDEGTNRFFEAWKKFNNKLVTFPLPTVAAINGHAFAGGAILAFLCDYRVMRTQRGWICFNEIQLKLRFSPHFYEIIRIKSKSPQVERDLVLFAKRFNAVDALNAGLVDEIVDERHLLESACQLAQKSLGTRGIDRNMLSTMKTDLYKSIVEADIVRQEETEAYRKESYKEATKTRL